MIVPTLRLSLPLHYATTPPVFFACRNRLFVFSLSRPFPLGRLRQPTWIKTKIVNVGFYFILAFGDKDMVESRGLIKFVRYWLHTRNFLIRKCIKLCSKCSLILVLRDYYDLVVPWKQLYFIVTQRQSKNNISVRYKIKCLGISI